jgi:N-acetylglutamate synthase-like GNAT family acetyltransferase
MPRLYIKEYRKSLAGKSIYIACREGILRNYFDFIVTDIKFLCRQNMTTYLFHNISNRVANQKIFRELSSRLYRTKIIRVPSNVAFYPFVLNYAKTPHKIVFIERTHLLDPEGKPVNSLTTSNARTHLESYRDLISNENLKENLSTICNKIEQAQIERVHIIPAGKACIKNELFSIEGSGTLIANNFNETFELVKTENDIQMIASILKRYRNLGYLKFRNKTYVKQQKDFFYVARIDDIIVGCAEQIPINAETVELGSLAVSIRFRKQQIGQFIIQSFEKEMIEKGVSIIISLTKNPLLQKIFVNLGFVQDNPECYAERQKQSPESRMFIKKI